MKKVVLFSLFFLIGNILKAQNIEREVIATSGDFYVNGTVSLSTTIGEPIIETISNGNFKLTQGFQQSSVYVSNVADNLSDFEARVYPNPIYDYLSVIVPEIKRQLMYSITGSEGKLISTSKLNTINTSIDMSYLPNGIYLLVLSENGQPVKTYQLIKQ